MKKYYYLFLVAIFALIFALPTATRAETGSSGDSSDDDSSTETEVEIESNSQDDDTNKPTLLRERLRVKTDGDKVREELRVKLLNGEKKLASTTRAEIRVETRQEMKDERIETRERIKSASSSEERREIRQEVRRELRQDQFEAHKNILVRQLTLALNNLKQIRDRISARIVKAEESGRNMTQAKTALATANTKITAAEQAIAALVAFTPTPVATTTTATTTATTTESSVDLTKPRQVGQTAINAVKAARESLNLVVRAIAHAMGLGGGSNATTTPATSTPPTNGTTTPPTATTTDPTATTTATTTNP